MLKVCIITSAHPVFDPRIFYKQAISLRNAGYNVLLIAQNAKNEYVNGVDIIGFNKPKTRFQRMFILTYHMIITAIKLKADVYHIHDPELLPWCIFLKVITNKVVIFDVHENFKKDVGSRYYINSSLSILISSIYSLIEKLVFKVIDFIFLAEDSYKKDYQYSNSCIIHNYPLINNRLIKTNKGLDNKNSPFFIISIVGQISRPRGVVEILYAVKKLLVKGHKDIRLNFIGAFENEEIIAVFSKLTKSLEIKEHITCYGQINHLEVGKLLKVTNLGLSLLHPIPNYLESFPTKIFEYYLNEVPVISSNFPYLTDIVKKDNCGIMVDPTDVDAIAGAIEFFINNPLKAKKMANNGFQLVTTKYNWQSEEKRLLATYNNFVA